MRDFLKGAEIFNLVCMQIGLHFDDYSFKGGSVWTNNSDCEMPVVFSDLKVQGSLLS